MFLKGHVLDDRRLYDVQKGDRKRKNFKAMISRYMADPIPGIRVKVSFMGKQEVVLTNDSGYFEVVFTFDRALSQHGWLKASYEVLDMIVEDQEPLTSTNEVFVLNPQSRYGVISDVDDTIIISHATNLLQKIRLILTKNSKTRAPFTGVSEFYQTLHKANPLNPVFYVSSSEWNLYDFLEDFCKTQNIPKGPFLLQELKTGLLKLFKSGGGSHQHKSEKIKHLMQTFKELPFVLIGDSGQRDAFIYAEMIQEFPNRVIAAYIRDVSRKRKDRKILKVANQIEDVEMLLVKDTADAAKHACRHGLISAADMEWVLESIKQESKGN